MVGPKVSTINRFTVTSTTGTVLKIWHAWTNRCPEMFTVGKNVKCLYICTCMCVCVCVCVCVCSFVCVPMYVCPSLCMRVCVCWCMYCVYSCPCVVCVVCVLCVCVRTFTRILVTNHLLLFHSEQHIGTLLYGKSVLQFHCILLIRDHFQLIQWVHLCLSPLFTLPRSVCLVMNTKDRLQWVWFSHWQLFWFILHLQKIHGLYYKTHRDKNDNQVPVSEEGRL